MRVQILGGFLGAGKTTLAHALARDAGATVAIAEAVGSCTDLVATVIGPLADRCRKSLSIDPLAVVVDPWRIHESATISLGEDVDFLFRKQVEEADVVLLSRADLAPPDVTAIINEWNPGAPVIAVSGRTNEGITEWRQSLSTHRSRPLSIDYDRYATAESLLGWCNARVQIRADSVLDVRDTMRKFLGAMATTPVAHVKVTSVDPAGVYGAVTRHDGEPQLGGNSTPHDATNMSWLVNARVALPPVELERCVRDAMSSAVNGGDVIWEELDCFSPGRPNPTHRYAPRCATTGDALCCTAFYQRDDVRRLLGDSYHPGGIELTLRMMRAVELRGDATVLDVACGSGESLRAILAEWPVRGIGVDSAAPRRTETRLELRTGDAHALPTEDASVDVVLCECALSTFIDQPGALREMHRVLRPGGFVAVSDMVIDGNVPESLRDWVHTGTCLERALSASAYERALCDAGFTIVDQWDASVGLAELLSRIKRNLIGWISAAASGTVSTPLPFDAGAARTTLRDASRAVSDGLIRYGVFIAKRAS